MEDKKLATAEGKITDEQKKKAAYALNMCMVSVSQIIDYDDLYVLEQEYDGILNNLNLEEMPKDEALLHILKQLLDTISYFRIADKEREVLEKEYQQKMKNAIWDAVPTVGLISTGGTPWSIAVSLASQVGIGYMNYRRSKAKILMEKDKNEWRLQRTAMEQFHGLRRELFDTAWRLADRYQFPDEYRITERQITEYNNILLDKDKLRRYERLNYVRGRFEAYPPFWYHLGSAANAIAQDAGYTEEVRARYRQYAEENFRRYLDGTEHNLLREDQLLASCALEYFELKLPELQKTKKGRTELEKLIDRARSAAGNQYDVLELCALSYLQLGEWKKGAEILRMLVNQSYNKVVNAQLLSSLYVSNYIESKDESILLDYATLGPRLGPGGGRFLFPMPLPNGEQDKELLETAFLEAQKNLLLQKAFLMIKALVERYTVRYNRAIPSADLDDSHEDAYYSDTLRMVRRDDTVKLLERGGNQWAEFSERMRSYTETIFQTLNDLQATLLKIPGVDERVVYEALAVPIQENGAIFLRTMEPEELTPEDIDALFETVDFRTMAGGALSYAAAMLREYVGGVKDMKEIAQAESKIQAVCNQEKLPAPEVVLGGESTAVTAELCRIGLNLLGREAAVAQRRDNKRKEMLECLEESRDGLFVDNGKKLKVEFLLNSDERFKTYRMKNIDLVKRMRVGELLAVIDDTALMSGDILFTTEGVILHQEENVLSALTAYTVPYNMIYPGKRGVLYIGATKYSDKQIDMDALYALIKQLAQIRDKYKSARLKAIEAHQDEMMSTLTTWEDILGLGMLPAAAGTGSALALPDEDEDLEDEMFDEDALVETSMELKRMTAEATKAVYVTVTTAAATSAIPIPFADAPMLIAQQVALMMKISSVFELDFKEDGLKTLVTTVLGVGGATFAGRTLATNLLKLVPLAGSALGGAIAAGTAGGVTLALGNAFIEVCKNIKLGRLSADDLLSQKGKDMLAQAFKGQMSKKKKASSASRTSASNETVAAVEEGTVDASLPIAKAMALFILAGSESDMGATKESLIKQECEGLLAESERSEFDAFRDEMLKKPLEGDLNAVLYELKTVLPGKICPRITSDDRAYFFTEALVMLPDDNSYSAVQRDIIKWMAQWLGVEKKTVLWFNRDALEDVRRTMWRKGEDLTGFDNQKIALQERLSRRWDAFVKGDFAAAEGRGGFDIVLVEVGTARAKLIKILHEITGLGMDEAMNLVENVPQVIRQGATTAEIAEIKEELEQVGARVEIVPTKGK